MVPSLKTSASIFPEDIFNSVFYYFRHDVITDLICIIEKHQRTSLKQKDISKTQKSKMPFFCILKGLSNKQKLFFILYTFLTLLKRCVDTDLKYFL